VERRRYRRYGPSELHWATTGTWESPHALTGGELRVVNLSYGGICLRTRGPLSPGTSLPLWVVTPLGTAWVRARVNWVRRLDGGEFLAGAEYLESSKGWFGPEEDLVHGVDREGVALVGALHEDCLSLQ